MIIALYCMKPHLSMFACKFIDNNGNKSRHHYIGTADSHLPRNRVRQVLDSLDAGSQIIKHGDTAVEKRTTIHCRLDTAPAAIEQTDAERMFKIGNCARDDRM